MTTTSDAVERIQRGVLLQLLEWCVHYIKRTEEEWQSSCTGRHRSQMLCKSTPDRRTKP